MAHKTAPEPEPSARTSRRFGGIWLVVAAVGAAFLTLALAALLTNIFERQQEARNPFYRVVELTDTTVDPATWGQSFPIHYDQYLRTVDMGRTRYGGSEALPVHTTDTDSRGVVSVSRLDEDPRLREFWAGYAFAEDFREERGTRGTPGVLHRLSRSVRHGLCVSRDRAFSKAFAHSAHQKACRITM